MTNAVQLNGVILRDFDPRDLAWYQQRKAYEESVSSLYFLIYQSGIRNFCDVGANYGLIGILAKQHGLRVLCVEADPGLIAKIEANFAGNDLHCSALINAIAGASRITDSIFSLNPSSSLDNRVCMPGWDQVDVPTVRLADLMAEHGFDEDGVFIKIDTQGYEAQVIEGLDPLLDELRHWYIKMEFAPAWLESQGTAPLQLLQSLLTRFEVVEFPERIVYGTPSLAALFSYPLRHDQAAEFLDYVVSLNRNRRGWVDLLVRPALQVPTQVGRSADHQ